MLYIMEKSPVGSRRCRDVLIDGGAIEGGAQGSGIARQSLALRAECAELSFSGSRDIDGVGRATLIDVRTVRRFRAPTAGEPARACCTQYGNSRSENRIRTGANGYAPYTSSAFTRTSVVSTGARTVVSGSIASVSTTGSRTVKRSWRSGVRIGPHPCGPGGGLSEDHRFVGVSRVVLPGREGDHLPVDR